jgi:enoyl-CoA hydratase/carnithine racemase
VSNAFALVFEGERLLAPDALVAGLLDEIAEPGSVVETAVARVQRWTEPGSLFSQHLALLRPPRAEVEAAMQRETAAFLEARETGVVSRGLAAFQENQAAI